MNPRVKFEVEGYECTRCHHKWVPRSESHPTICPKCKSPYWDRPKEKKAKS